MWSQFKLYSYSGDSGDKKRKHVMMATMVSSGGVAFEGSLETGDRRSSFVLLCLAETLF